MTAQEMLAQGIFPIVFLLWAELRFLPLVRLAIGWGKAHALKAGVTHAQALSAAPVNSIFPKP